MNKADDVPEWAIVRARALLEAEQKSGIAGHVNRAFARYIAANEPAPVDPLREVVKAAFLEADCDQKDGCDWTDDFVSAIRARLPGIDDLARSVTLEPTREGERGVGA